MRRTGREAREWLVGAAFERQRLGLTRAEYFALTPFEIACELEAREILDAERRLAMEALDEHLARLELLANGFQFPGMKSVSDFRLLRRRRAKATDRGDGAKLAADFALKREREKREFLKRRDEIRKRRAEKDGN